MKRFLAAICVLSAIGLGLCACSNATIQKDTAAVNAAVDPILENWATLEAAKVVAFGLAAFDMPAYTVVQTAAKAMIVCLQAGADLATVMAVPNSGQALSTDAVALITKYGLTTQTRTDLINLLMEF